MSDVTVAASNALRRVALMEDAHGRVAEQEDIDALHAVIEAAERAEADLARAVEVLTWMLKRHVRDDPFACTCDVCEAAREGLPKEEA